MKCNISLKVVILNDSFNKNLPTNKKHKKNIVKLDRKE